MLSVLHIIAGLQAGGAEAVLYRLVTADKGNHHRVISLTTDGSYGTALADVGVQLDTMGMPRGRIAPQGVLRLARLISRIRPDVVQTWMYHADIIGGVAARLVGRKPVVWSIRASDADVGSVRLGDVVSIGARLSGHVPTSIICNSYSGARIHAARGYDAAKMTVVTNGYDTNVLVPNISVRRQLRDEWGIPPGTALLGMVARWDPLKDHQNLVASLRLLGTATPRPWVCVLVGGEMTRANTELVALLERYGMVGRVRLMGLRPDIPNIMSALDIHVLSSKSEGFPNAVAEAMACGTPCVATDVGDAALIVGETGWIAPPAHALAFSTALKTAILEMGDERSWRSRQAECRSRIIRKFNIDRMVAAHDTVWKEAFSSEHRDRSR